MAALAARSVAGRPAFASCSGRAPVAAPRVALARRAAVRVNYSDEPIGGVPCTEYPHPKFIAETLAAFPEKGMATVEEARVLLANGYTWLDVRSELERDEIGKVKQSVNVPFMHCKRVYSAEEGKKIVQKTPNKDFMQQVRKKFPNLETKLMVGCANGRQYSIDALEQLDEAGYTNLTFVRGGYNRWTQVWDHNLRRRNNGEYQETNSSDQLGQGDSCGIHASGAGFDRVDKADKWTLPVY